MTHRPQLWATSSELITHGIFLATKISLRGSEVYTEAFGLEVLLPAGHQWEKYKVLDVFKDIP